MKHMLSFWISFILLGFGPAQSIQAQTIDSLYLFPAHPVPGDTICVIAQTTFTSGACNVTGSNALFESNAINLFVSYTVGVATYICHSTDTFKIGVLPAGNYELTYNLGIPGNPVADIRNMSFAVQVPNSILEPEFKNIRIYPNPFKNQINIDLSNILTEKGSLKIFDINSRLVFKANLSHISGSTIDLSAIQKGVYFIEWYNDEYSHFQKLIKTE